MEALNHTIAELLDDTNRLARVFKTDASSFIAFAAFEGLLLFLSDTHKNDAIFGWILSAHPCRDIVLALLSLKAMRGTLASAKACTISTHWSQSARM